MFRGICCEIVCCGDEHRDLQDAEEVDGGDAGRTKTDRNIPQTQPLLAFSPFLQHVDGAILLFDIVCRSFESSKLLISRSLKWLIFELFLESIS